MKRDEKKHSETNRFVLYEDNYGKKKIDVELPLTSTVDIEELANDLGLPTCVDKSYLPMRRAIVALWACQNAHKLHEMFPDKITKRISKRPISALLFGGGAVKIYCSCANVIKGPCCRHLKDVDFIVAKKQGIEFYKLLLRLGDLFGSEYIHFETGGDRSFGFQRHGTRYRIRTIDEVDENGIPKVGVMDIFCDEIDLRHKVKVKEEFKNPKETFYTIGMENMILSKCQFIMDLPASDLPRLEKAGQAFRVLKYNHLPNRLVIGMEEKDTSDVCAILLDHPIGHGREEIDPTKMARVLRKDKKFAVTCRLNLQNVYDHPEILKGFGLTKAQVSTVEDRVGILLKAIPVVNAQWDKPWWNTQVETPKIFD
ncbi:MAG: hypothetical protein JSV85_05225 [Candidatus Bathyarchaeota archaeon]|nr:MAG: hypothetical protein JSV85_05225 [Candidatus Bathyarchaeota archaeon]